MPIQVQLGRDEEFLTESLEVSGHAGQVFDSDQPDISGSDIDISALLNTFDQNSAVSSPTVKKHHKVAGNQSDICESDIDISALLNIFYQNSAVSSPTVKNIIRLHNRVILLRWWGTEGGGGGGGG